MRLKRDFSVFINNDVRNLKLLAEIYSAIQKGNKRIEKNIVETTQF